MRGKIKNDISGKKFGFIRAGDGQDYYFNESSLCAGVVMQSLTKSTELEFEIQIGNKGPRAVNCRIVENEDIQFFKDHVLSLSENKEQYDIFCDHAKNYAERLKNDNGNEKKRGSTPTRVTTSMIRKIYARVLNARRVTDLKLLRPHFAYTAGRNEDNPTLREFMDLLDYLVKKMETDNEQHLKNFKQFMEAIVAYRKYVGNDK
jgi:CRISPR type III-A-associated protein Csm2